MHLQASNSIAAAFVIDLLCKDLYYCLKMSVNIWCEFTVEHVMLPLMRKSFQLGKSWLHIVASLQEEK